MTNTPVLKEDPGKPAGIVAMIVYEWSRLHTGGSIRAVTFARVLASRGWKVNVITATPPDEWPEMPDAITVHHIPSPEKGFGGGIEVDQTDSTLDRNPPWLRALGAVKALFPLERQLSWYPAFRRQAPRICRQAGVNRVLSVIAPNTLMPLGHHLARHLGVPHWIDLRDDFADRHAVEKVTRSYQRLLNWYGHRYLSRADAVSVVSPVTQQRLATRGIRAELVMNGYLEAHFSDLGWSAAPVAPGPVLKILHLGWLGNFRSIAPLISAISGMEDPNCVALEQYGLIDPEQARLIERAPCETSIHAQVSHREAIALMKDADMLLAIPGDRVPAAMTGKLFEYLRARRPVLLLAGEGAARQLALGAGVRHVHAPDDVEGLTAALEQIVQDKRAGRLITTSDPAFVRTLDREISAGRLERMLREVAA